MLNGVYFYRMETDGPERQKKQDKGNGPPFILV